MQDTTDPRDIDRRDVGQTNPRSAERKSGVGGWLGVGIGMWFMVVVIGLVFVAAILVFAL